MISSRIVCSHIEPRWKPGIISELKNSADLWKIRLPENFKIPGETEAVLNTAEHEAASRFHHAKDRQNFIMRRGALRMLLAEYTGVKASEIEFTEGENKKPVMNTGAAHQIHFNVSHSGECALIAISDHELGVDIEEFKPSFNYREILHHGFSTQEIEYITRSGNPAKSFFRIWTRKEALIKATSKGVDDDLDKIPGLDGSHDLSLELPGSEHSWVVKSFDIGSNYQGSIAHFSGNSSVNFFGFPLTAWAPSSRSHTS